MGRIKTTLIKRSTKELVEKHGNELSADFSKNKEVVNKRVDVSSKKLRNIMAGYASRLVKKQKQ